MSIFNKFCGDCGFREAQGSALVCSIFRIKVDPNLDSCPKYVYELYMKHCEICGQPLLVPGIVDIVDGNPHLICTTCGSKMNTCETCREISKCDFETNPSPIEKTINKQVRQGNMVMMTTVKNPKRIDETCKKNCKCYDEKNECRRQNIQTCGHWCTPY